VSVAVSYWRTTTDISYYSHNWSTVYTAETDSRYVPYCSNHSRKYTDYTSQHGWQWQV